MTDEWIDGCMEEYGCIDKLTEWRMNGWVYRRMGGGMCGRRDGCMTYCLSPLSAPTPYPFSSPLSSQLGSMK
jgi:hypothetical protein